MFAPRQNPFAYRNPPIRQPFFTQPRGQVRPGRRMIGQPNQPNSLLSHFRNEDGKWDFQKIASTASQMRGMYNQVAGFVPMITRFLGR
ncbi:YppG family protein [Bacillus salitolerans]|uniref:YppG family protein n=1 Tax=Bacillus salitolerans TaxID=1437434 RepID=A0ABW4LV01_9BACI